MNASQCHVRTMEVAQISLLIMNAIAWALGSLESIVKLTLTSV